MELKKIITGMVIAFLIFPTVSVSGKDKKTKAAGKEIFNAMQRFVEYVTEQAKELKDIELLAEVIYHENWHTDKDKLTARWTGAVVMNRVKSKQFPNTVEEVLYQKNPTQYSTTQKFFTVELPEECYQMAADIYRNGTPEVPETVLYQATFSQGKLWKKLNGEYFCYG